jgi:hypothetical protein
MRLRTRRTARAGPTRRPPRLGNDLIIAAVLLGGVTIRFVDAEGRRQQLIHVGIDVPVRSGRENVSAGSTLGKSIRAWTGSLTPKRCAL